MTLSGNCGKVRYRDRLGALIALSSTQRSVKARRDGVRVYRCPKCHGWHLTSGRLRDPAAPRPRRSR
jgi:Transcription factor zinc-finger